MQASKKKKFIIAGIILLVIIAVIAVIIIKEATKPKRYLSGDMTLVDRLGKGTEFETEVYITSSQDILFKVANCAKSDIYVKEAVRPAYEFSYEDEVSDNSTNINILIEKNLGQEETSVKYPANCYVVLVSDVLGLEIRIDFNVDKEVTYKKGELTTKKVDPTKIKGYNEYVEKLGPIRLPEKARIYEITRNTRQYGTSDEAVELSVIKYMYNGRMRELSAVKSLEKDKFAGITAEEATKVLTVNGIEVLVFSVKDSYLAYYTDGDVIYLNFDFLADEDASEKAMIKALEAYISK